MSEPRWIKYALMAVSSLIAVHFLRQLWKFVQLCGNHLDFILHSSPKLILIKRTADVSRVTEIIIQSCQRFPVIGLDCEWGSHQKQNACSDESSISVSRHSHPPFLENLALIQIATYDGSVFVFQLRHLTINDSVSGLEQLGLQLRSLLENKKIIKVGVGIDNDCRKIMTLLNCNVQSWLDLRFLAHELNQSHVKGFGLAKLSKTLLDRDLAKAMQLSDWTVDTLSDDQLSYAANDSLTSLKVFTKYFLLYQRSWHGSLEEFTRTKVFFCCNKKYKLKVVNGSCSAQRKGIVNGSDVDVSRVVSNMAVPPKNRGVPARYLASCKSEIYSNGLLLAPDGQLLCTCSMNKLRWYCYKQLGEFVDDKSVRLFFEPANRPAEDSEYYRLPKNNRCVVCGKDSNLLRKNVVPVEYRKHFPPSIKSHQSHDTLVLCVGCHVDSNWHDLKLRRQLEAECDAPLGALANIVKRHAPSLLKQAIHSAKALVAHSESMPQSRILQLKKPIAGYLGVANESLVSMRQISEVAQMNPLNPEQVFEPHGLKVCRSYVEKKLGLEALKQRWRAHFIDTMSPQYLPELWCVEHRPKYKGNLIDDCSHDVLSYLEKGGKYQNCLKVFKPPKAVAVAAHTT